MLTYLRIEGAPEYWDIMDKNLSAAMAGQKTAQQALDDTAAAWEEITDRLGRDKILSSIRRRSATKAEPTLAGRPVRATGRRVCPDCIP